MTMKNAVEDPRAEADQTAEDITRELVLAAGPLTEVIDHRQLLEFLASRDAAIEATDGILREIENRRGDPTDMLGVEAGEAQLGVLKSLLGTLDDNTSEAIGEAHRRHKALTTARRKMGEPLTYAEARLKGAIRDRRIAQADYLRRKAEIEAEEARKREEDLALAAAAEAEARGDSASATAILEEAAEAPPPAVVEPVVRATGSAQIRHPWVGVVDDVRKLCAAIGRGELPTELVEVRQAEVNRRAREYREEAFPVGSGARAFEDTAIASGRG